MVFGSSAKKESSKIDIEEEQSLYYELPSMPAKDVVKEEEEDEEEAGPHYATPNKGFISE